MKTEATWSNISNASNSITEVKAATAAPLNLKPLCDVLEEGFKMHLMTVSSEITDMLEAVEKSLQEHTNQLGAVGVGIMDIQRDLVEELGRLSTRTASIGLSIDMCAKNLDSIEDNLPNITNAIKGIKLDANIPITNLSVGLPRGALLYAILAPVIFSLLSLLISRIH